MSHCSPVTPARSSRVARGAPPGMAHSRVELQSAVTARRPVSSTCTTGHLCPDRVSSAEVLEGEAVSLGKVVF